VTIRRRQGRPRGTLASTAVETEWASNLLAQGGRIARLANRDAELQSPRMNRGGSLVILRDSGGARRFSLRGRARGIPRCALEVTRAYSAPTRTPFEEDQARKEPGARGKKRVIRPSARAQEPSGGAGPFERMCSINHLDGKVVVTAREALQGSHERASREWPSAGRSIRTWVVSHRCTFCYVAPPFELRCRPVPPMARYGNIDPRQGQHRRGCCGASWRGRRGAGEGVAGSARRPILPGRRGGPLPPDSSCLEGTSQAVAHTRSPIITRGAVDRGANVDVLAEAFAPRRRPSVTFLGGRPSTLEVWRAEPSPARRAAAIIGAAGAHTASRSTPAVRGPARSVRGWLAPNPPWDSPTVRSRLGRRRPRRGAGEAGRPARASGRNVLYLKPGTRGSSNFFECLGSELGRSFLPRVRGPLPDAAAYPCPGPRRRAGCASRCGALATRRATAVRDRAAGFRLAGRRERSPNSLDICWLPP